MPKVLSLPLQCVTAALCVCLCFGRYEAQAQTHGAPSLREFFDVIVQRYDPKTLPGTEEVMRAIDQIAKMSSPDIVAALPSILRAFRHEDDTVKGYAALAMFAIGERSDGAKLLASYSGAIANGLDFRKPQLQGMTLQLLAMTKPEPQSPTVATLVAFVKRTDRSPLAQADAISLLLRIAPDDPDLTPALQDFLARPMEEQTKDAIVNAIANSHTENTVAADALIRFLQDPSEQVRFQAAQAINRMPNDMIRRGQVALQQTIERADESSEVKAAAQEALNTLARRK